MSFVARRCLVLGAGLLLLGGGFGLGLLVAGGGSDARDRLLEATAALRAEGTDFVFTLPRAGEVLVTVTLPARCTSRPRTTLAPLRTALREEMQGGEVRYEPQLPAPHEFSVGAGTTQQRLRLGEPGPYVLRIEPVPMAMGAERDPMWARAAVEVAR